MLLWAGGSHYAGNRPRAQLALRWLAVRRQEVGRWCGSSSSRQRTRRQLEGPEVTCRRVSLKSEQVL